MSKLSIDDLAPAPYNPREITDAAADGLRASVARFGDIGGITYNERTGRLVCGHQRVKQLRALGAQMVDGALQLASGHRFPVRVVDWSEAEEKAANVEANNPHIAGTFNADLDGLLGELRGSMGELEFEELRFDELLSEQPDATGDVEQDEVPEPPAEPVCKVGDVWTLGGHLLVCGDARQQELYHLCDIIVTSPPYCAGREIESNADSRYMSQSDDDIASWVELLCSFTTIALTVSQVSFVNLQLLQPNKMHLVEWLSRYADALKEVIIWDKGHGAPAMAAGVLNSAFEFIFALSTSDNRRKFSNVSFHGTESNVLRVGKSSGIDGVHHKATYPVEVPGWVIRTFSRDGALVLDPFSGSGTTLIAAEQLNRRCHAIEIEPKYCDVIIERWQQLSGGKAQRKAG